MIAPRIPRVLVAAATACVVWFVPATPGQAAPVAVVTDDSPCALTVTAPRGLDLTAQAYLQCPKASPTAPLSVTMRVCAERFHGFIIGTPWRWLWEDGDGCRDWAGTIDDGLVPFTEEDRVPCGPLPLYRGIATATVAGRRLQANSDERPGLACPDK